MSAPGHDDLPHSPAAERNREPIRAVLARLLGERAAVLEIASGTGQHAEHCVAMHPGWTWQPTEARADALPAIAARCASLPQVLPPRVVDVLDEPWPLDGDGEGWDAVVCVNLLHIAPWPACAALMAGAARRLAPHGRLVVYGPFVVDGRPTAPGNVVFDTELRMRDPAWGLRRLADVEAEAQRAGLALREDVAMPANNRTLVFGRAGAG